MTQPVRVLVVGGGSIGERHVRCFQGAGRATVALCEIGAARRAEVAERCRLSDTFGDWQAALDWQPDVVVVATPAHLHLRMAAEAVGCGAAVLIEKPLSTSFDGLSQLEQQIATQQKPVGVAYVYRCHPALVAMRQALIEGRFGRPLEVVAVSGQDFPFYRPAYRETYYTRHETGGGAVQDALTHIINAVEWLVGPVDRLVADADHLAVPDVTVEDTVHVLARHGGVLSSFTLNQHQAPNESTITVVCERGTARFEYHAHRWRWVIEPGAAWYDEPGSVIERDTLFIAQAEQFLEAATGAALPRCTLAEAAQTLRVNLAILNSVRSRTWQDIRPTS